MKQSILMRRALQCCRLLPLLTALVLAACSGSLQQPIERFDFAAPKPFGYVIGDKITHRLTFETRPGIIFDPASLPGKGDLNRWLSVDQIRIQTHSEHVTTIDLTYQVFYAPLEVKMLAIPGFKLRFKQGEHAIEQAVPEWSFTVSPLHELTVRKEEGNTYRRPDATPSPTPTQSVWQSLWISLALALISACLLAYRYGYFPGLPKRSAFSRACKQLKNMRPDDIGPALTIIHQAFNTLNSKPLFKHRLPEFYRRRPEFKALSNDLEWFFSFSDNYFFGSNTATGNEEWAELKSLCQRCLELERG